ncbi:MULTISPECIES: hypothetical protein [Methylobacterium]|uniref:hypothetical protein n=1 Tax=Methylobacterium TaxID=407 RepID=UPI000A4F2698|nr:MULTISPECIES: hypothetical protein [Methylobacterium]MCI9879831.1 hypothetical protein [Methylobacterium goesingense]
MSAWAFVEQINDGLAFLAILAALVVLAVAFAPEMPARRLPAPAKRMRDTGRY